MPVSRVKLIHPDSKAEPRAKSQTLPSAFRKLALQLESDADENAFDARCSAHAKMSGDGVKRPTLHIPRDANVMQPA
jgi:hypothetical protein